MLVVWQLWRAGSIRTSPLRLFTIASIPPVSLFKERGHDLVATIERGAGQARVSCLANFSVLISISGSIRRRRTANVAKLKTLRHIYYVIGRRMGGRSHLHAAGAY